MIKKYLYRSTLCALVAIGSACSSDKLINEPINDKQITITAPNFIYADLSRTSFDITNDGAKFTWAENDTVGIFPLEGHQVDFPMSAGAGTNMASFNGGSWALKPSATYMAYYPYNFDNRKYNEISVDLNYQEQTGNASTAHIGKYDYMAAAAKTPQEGAVAFEFKHLTSLIQLTLTVPKKGYLKYVSLTSSEDVFITEGAIDLSASEPMITSTYKSNYITLYTNNIETTTDEATVQLYLMLAPVDLTGKQIKVEFLNNDVTYSGSIEVGQLLPGKAYRYKVDAQKLVIDQNTFNVPAEGGQFTTAYNSNFPLFTENPCPGSDSSIDSGASYFKNLYSDTSSQNIDPKVQIAPGRITIDVAPAGFRNDKATIIPLYNQFGDIVVNLTINQKGNPNAKVPLLGADGGAYWTNMIGQQVGVFNLRTRLENNFIQTKEAILPTSQEIESYWGKFYSVINGIHRVKEEDNRRLACYQSYFNVSLALLHYTQVQYWGGVPYYEKPLNPDEGMHIMRKPINEIYSSLITKLENAIPYLDEKKNDSFTDVNSAFFVSRDVANILLGYILLDQKEYSKAITHLEKVINSGRYEIEKSAPNYYANNNECILGFNNQNMPEILPCLDYKELLVMAAECYHKLNQENTANELIQQIATSKGIQLEGTNVLANIAKVRIECELPYTVPFIRRNDMGNSVLGIDKNSLYLLLWPIPQRELNTNMYIYQNPGY